MRKNNHRSPNMNTQATNETDNRNRTILGAPEPDRTDRSMDDRARDDFYDLPDYDNIDFSEAASRRLQLFAPDPRIDEAHGPMHQRWVNTKLSNGRRVDDLRLMGYRPRNPSTVPNNFSMITEKWQNRDVILVDGVMMLMEIPMKVYRKFQTMQIKKTDEVMQSIKKNHGTLLNSSDNKLSNPGKFMQTVEVKHDDVGGDVSFDD